MKIKVNDVCLYYEKIGHGRPLIMVHGNGENHHIFDQAVMLLKKYFCLYLIDSRGHGLSTSISVYSYQAMCEDMIAFIEALQLKHVSYFGYSDGGIVGLLLASQYPHMVENLIVAGANTHPHGVDQKAYLDMKKEYRITKSPLIKMMLEQPHISSRELRKIKARTLVLAGEYDLIRYDHTLNIANNIAQCTLQIVDNADHGSYIVDSDHIAKILIDFLNHK